MLSFPLFMLSATIFPHRAAYRVVILREKRMACPVIKVKHTHTHIQKQNKLFFKKLKRQDWQGECRRKEIKVSISCGAKRTEVKQCKTLNRGHQCCWVSINWVSIVNTFQGFSAMPSKYLASDNGCKNRERIKSWYGILQKMVISSESCLTLETIVL